MDNTAKELGVKDSYDAEQNIMGGAKLLSQLLKKYDGDRNKALAGYNAGTGNVAKYGAEKYSSYYNKVNANEKALFKDDNGLDSAVDAMKKKANQIVEKSDEEYWGKETTFKDILTPVIVVLFGVCAFVFITAGIGINVSRETIKRGVKL